MGAAEVRTRSRSMRLARHSPPSLALAPRRLRRPTQQPAPPRPAADGRRRCRASCRANVRPLHYTISVVARRRQSALHRLGADRHRGARSRPTRSPSTPPTSTSVGRAAAHRRRAPRPRGSRLDAEAQTATFRFADADRARPLPAGDRLFGQDQHPGRRPVRARLRQRRRAEARALHPVRGARRAPLLPGLGRAQFPHALRSHASPFPPARTRSATCPQAGRETQAGRQPRSSPSRPPRPCRATCSSSPSASSTGSRPPRPAPRSASSPSAATARRAAGRSKARPRSCPGTTTISAPPIRCPSSTMSPARAAASSSARWRIGARSSRSRSILLVDPAITTEARRQRIFEVAAHEIAHQWFGDLVTMAWWDDLWLNEGFASWMATKATDRAPPRMGARARPRRRAANRRSTSIRVAHHPSGRPARSPPSSRSARRSTRSPTRRARR